MIDLDRNSTDSEIIDWLRFPLAVIVVAIHIILRIYHILFIMKSYLGLED